jgi:cell division protein FtsB
MIRNHVGMRDDYPDHPDALLFVVFVCLVVWWLGRSKPTDAEQIRKLQQQVKDKDAEINRLKGRVETLEQELRAYKLAIDIRKP